jgi:hypothetical protein
MEAKDGKHILKIIIINEFVFIFSNFNLINYNF